MSKKQFEIEPIAHISTDFPSKFGIPRQSGVVPTLKGTIVFCPKYRNLDSLRGLEGFTHLWLIWSFSANSHSSWQPMVRPPRLGGNTQVGVFASRSPFRPNHLGLSAVKIESIELDTPQGPVIHVLGADLMDGTPIFDIKPYVTYADCIPDACSGFVDKVVFRKVKVIFPSELHRFFNEQQTECLIQVLENDPRPSCQNNAEKIYGMPFAGFDVHFRVTEGVLEVIGVEPLDNNAIHCEQ